MKKSHDEIVRACFAAYETKDRAALEAVIASDFTFSSPIDDNISRGQYFQRCWPNSEHVGSFDIKKLFVDGDEVLVQYEAHLTTGGCFRNTEAFTLRDGQITHVEVYFGAETAESATEEEIRSVLEAHAEAIRRKDVEKLSECFAPDAVLFSFAPPLQEIWPVRENFAAWFETFLGDIGCESEDASIHASGDLAHCYRLSHMTGKKVEGEEVDLWFRETLCLQKLDAHWRITHVHESVPFYMDGSFKAAVDLKPEQAEER